MPVDLAGTVITEIVKAVTETAVKAAAERIKRERNITLVADVTAATRLLEEHLYLLRNWSTEITFRHLLKSKALQDSFINLDCLVGLHDAGATANRGAALLVTTVLDTPGNVVILALHRHIVDPAQLARPNLWT